MDFSWTDKEDDNLLKYGITITWVIGRAKAIQKFVEALSYKIGYKCDFSFVAGKAHIDVSKDGYSKALEALHDKSFMSNYIVPYSKATYDNETYFEILK